MSDRERVRSLRSFVTTEHGHLLERHRFGLGGREIARGRADFVDLVVARVCRMVAEDLGPSARFDLAACAVAAVGGYGRHELSPHSDVDVLLLHPGTLTTARVAFLESVLPLLWDAGLEIGHAVRSIAECVELGRSDLHARNAMSEARLVAGDSELFHRFAAEMHTSVYRDAKANRFFAEAMREEVAARRGRYGAVVGVLEPNLKESAGGLRDLHVIGWVGLARHGLMHLDEMVRAGLVTPAEHRNALRASDVLLRVRNELHFQTGRATDVMSLDLQPSTAAAMGYADRHFASAAELFMRALYHRAEELMRVSEAFLQRADFWTESTRRFPLPWSRTVSAGPDRRYRIRDGQLHLRPGEEELGHNPFRLLEIFREAQRHEVGISPELRERVRARLALIDRSARNAPEATDGFVDILRGPRVGRTLRAMHESGLLVRLLPEFRRVTLLVQHDQVHQYTIDEHTLRVLEGLDHLAESRDEPLAILRGAMESVEDRAVLALGALLHDIGKGRGAGTDHAARGAVMAKRVGRRLGLAERKLDDVVFLVQKHLVMSRTSQRRDLSDDAVIQGFADTVGTENRLNLLYVLTYADLAGVAPGNWNEWKNTLLTELYLKALPRVEGHSSMPVAPEARAPVEERVLRELSPEFLRSDVEEFLSHLPSRYARALPPEIIASHFELTRALGSKPVVTDWMTSKRAPYSVLAVCAPDAPGLLALLAGALTGSGLDILSLDVFTHDDGVALDVFRVVDTMGAEVVQPVDEALHEVVNHNIEAALRGELDVEAAVDRQRIRQRRRRRGRTSKGPDVRFEEPDALGRTPIEVRADDEPGLLYRISSTFATLGLNISAAKVATEKNQALDIFYVEGPDGGPLPEARQEEVRAALFAALEGSALPAEQRRGA